MTRAVVLYELMSLDGFADDPGEGQWFGDADARLIDFLGDVRLVLVPSLAGTGKPLFGGDGPLQRFELLSNKRSGGCLLLHYRRRQET